MRVTVKKPVFVVLLTGLVCACGLGVRSAGAKPESWKLSVEVGGETRTGKASVESGWKYATVSIELGDGGFEWYAKKNWPLVLPRRVSIETEETQGRVSRLIIEIDEDQGRSMTANGLFIAVDSCLHVLAALRALPRVSEKVETEYGVFMRETTTFAGAVVVVAKGGEEYQVEVADIEQRIDNLRDGVYSSYWRYVGPAEDGKRCYRSYVRNPSGMSDMRRRVTLYGGFFQPDHSELAEIQGVGGFGDDDRPVDKRVAPTVRFEREITSLADIPPDR